MKRRWMVASVLTAMVALGISGGAVLAQTAGPNGDTPVKGIISRVASILGLEEAKVQDAFDEATAEMRAEKIKARLDALEAEARRRGLREAELNAQTYAILFYSSHGYAEEGTVFLDAGIDHVLMRKRL